MIKRVLAGAVGALTLLALASCSDGKEQNYAIPAKLCGASVKPELTKDLLPGGNKLEVNESESNSSSPRQFCTLIVDGNIELMTEGRWQPSGVSAKDAAEKSLVFNTQSTQSGRFAIGNQHAITVVDCKNSKYKAERFSIDLEMADEQEGMGDKMERFLDAFSESYRSTLPCE
ncbi:hypothetical protein [Streptomyces sp. NPDC000880]